MALSIWCSPRERWPPGASIPTHKHVEQDEIVLIEKGTVHAQVGGQERDLHAGGMVFIPQHTWVSLKNTGTEPASMVAIFSAPGFEDHLRCESVPAGEKPTTLSRAEENVCDRLGHVVYHDRGETPTNVRPAANQAQPAHESLADKMGKHSTRSL
jgi:gentisate 1,2-dioxygenase